MSAIPAALSTGRIISYQLAAARDTGFDHGRGRALSDSFDDLAKMGTDGVGRHLTRRKDGPPEVSSVERREERRNSRAVLSIQEKQSGNVAGSLTSR